MALCRFFVSCGGSSGEPNRGAVYGEAPGIQKAAACTPRYKGDRDQNQGASVKERRNRKIKGDRLCLIRGNGGFARFVSCFPLSVYAILHPEAKRYLPLMMSQLSGKA